MYPEFLIGPMREELTRHGVRELRSAADVDEALMNTPGTVMVVVNSVCGCAAGKARPGVALALQHAVKPDLVTTVFAGGDVEATGAGTRLLHRISALVSVDRAPARRHVDLHDGAASDRKPGSPGHRRTVDSGVRHALPQDGGGRLALGAWFDVPASAAPPCVSIS